MTMSGEKILIIDDDKKIREIFSKLLSSEGFRVVEASSAPTGYNVLKREDVDLVLLDIKMPEDEGKDVYKAIRAFHKGIKVIVSSVCQLEEQKQMIPEATDYYDKSEGTEALLKKIRGALKETFPG